MRRSIQLVLVAAIITLTDAWLWAQTPIKTPSGAELNIGTFEGPARKPAELASSPPLATTTVEAINLRNQYIELSKKKALLMKEPELKREIEMLERDIPELEAWAKAEEAVQLLHEVIEKHPNTQAAKSAQAAIELIKGRGREEFLVPTPDDGILKGRIHGLRPVAPSAPRNSNRQFDDPQRAAPAAPRDRDFQRESLQPKPTRSIFQS